MDEPNGIEPYGLNSRIRRAPGRAAETRVLDLSDAFEILEPAEGVDLRAWAQVIRKRLSAILIVFFVVFALVVIATFKQKRAYRAQAVLEIQKENPEIPTVQELYQLESLSDDYLRTQYSILQSDSLARRVIDQLHLDVLPEYNASKWWDWRRVKRTSPKQSFATEPAPAERDGDLYQRVLDRFRDRLTVEPINRSRLVAVRFESQDPELSARVANTLAEDYLELNLQSHWTTAQKTGDWLSQQLTGVKAKLEKSEDSLQTYARRNGLIFFENDKGNIENAENERLQQLQEELTRAQAERIAKEGLYRLVQAGDYGSLPGVFDNKMLQDLTVRLADLKREHAQLTTTFNDDYPRVKEVQSQIDEIQASLQEERRRAADQISNEYVAAVNRESLLRQTLGAQQNQMNLVAEKSVQYNILKREVDTNKQMYEGLLQQLKITGISSSLKASNIRIVDSAEPPANPARPKIPLNLAVGAVLGLALGVCAAFLQDRLDNTVKGDDDVERMFGLSALALIPAVPHLNGDQRGLLQLLGHGEASNHGSNGNGRKPAATWYRIDALDPKRAALMEAFRTLRASILLSTADHPPNSLLVTSTQPAEGKTTVASNLAIALSQVGQRVLLVDADLRSPSLHRLFGTRESAGLVSYLAGHQDWCSAVRPSGIPGLDVVFCGSVPPNPSELLSSQRMGALVRAAREKYDMVIFDSAPLLALADSRILSPLMSGVVLVVKNGTTPREHVLHAQSTIRSTGGNFIGAVLNQVDPRTNGYYEYGNYGAADHDSSQELSPMDHSRNKGNPEKLKSPAD